MLVHLFQVMHVNSVTTRQNVDKLCRVEKILKTHRVVVVHFFFHTRVEVLQVDSVAIS